MSSSNSYDAIIIGAGMSGLAAGIRLSMYGKRICILEKHTVPGGLNSYYQRGKRLFDVGLHAMTNFSRPKERRLPLNRLLRQLRISYEELHLSEQNKSKILFPEVALNFSNDFSLLLEEVATHFPHQIEGFQKLVRYIENFNELDLTHPYQSAKKVVREFISDDYLLEMLFCPLLIYGSAWEMDMDFSQFVVMFKSIYLQGLCRPEGGVRRIVNLLLKRLQEEGGELRYGSEVKEISVRDGRTQGVLLGSGEFLTSSCILSSIGHPETLHLCSLTNEVNISGVESGRFPRTGELSFTETLLVVDQKAFHYDWDHTLVFYNNRPHYEYRKPVDLVDSQSAVLCCSDNFHMKVDGPVRPIGPVESDQPERKEEGMLRVTLLANSDGWTQLDKAEYKREKEKVFQISKEIIHRCIPSFQGNIVFKDVFTPKTITRYTGHWKGAVYGSPDKLRDGKTSMAGLYLCGTDQGFLGIVGAMLSGITVANLYGLEGEHMLKGTH